MGLFTKRPAAPPWLSLTPEAVSTVLLGAGLEAAEYDGYRPTGDGFVAYTLPVTHEDRVGVYWHADPYTHDDHRLIEANFLVICASRLEAAGYQTEFAAESASTEYLVVWTEGEF